MNENDKENKNIYISSSKSKNIESENSNPMKQLSKNMKELVGVLENSEEVSQFIIHERKMKMSILL